MGGGGRGLGAATTKREGGAFGASARVICAERATRVFVFEAATHALACVRISELQPIPASPAWLYLRLAL